MNTISAMPSDGSNTIEKCNNVLGRYFRFNYQHLTSRFVVKIYISYLGKTNNEKRTPNN